MSRITVEDCIVRLPDVFRLVLLAAHRARQLGKGSEPTVPTNEDKRTVLALREIAAATVSPEVLVDSLVTSIQRFVSEADESVEPIAVSCEEIREEEYAAGMAAVIPHADTEESVLGGPAYRGCIPSPPSNTV